MVRNIVKLVLVSALTVFAHNGTYAQQQSEINVKASGWYKICSDTEQGKVCNVQFQVQTTTNQLITSLNLIEIDGEQKRRIFRIVVPSARAIPPGVQITIDGKQASGIPYIFCRPQICVAEVGLNDALVKVFKAGGGLDVVTVDFQDKPQPVPITLKGFTAAYDGPPREQPQDVSSEQDKLKKQLEQKIQSQSE